MPSGSTNPAVDGVTPSDDDYGSADANAVGSVLATALSGLAASLSQPNGLNVALFGGVSSYVSARIARDEPVRLREAFRVAFENLWAYLWLQIIIFVKVALWSLLLVIPGIIMSVRYSLAGVAFYDDKKHLRGNAAVKESLRLTKNGWLTTFASNTLFNLITLGAIGSIISTSVNAMLYKQFDKAGAKKPEAHWLSWATLLIPIILVIFYLAFASLAVLVATLVGLGGL